MSFQLLGHSDESWVTTSGIQEVNICLEGAVFDLDLAVLVFELVVPPFEVLLL